MSGYRNFIYFITYVFITSITLLGFRLGSNGLVLDSMSTFLLLIVLVSAFSIFIDILVHRPE